jgi:cytochrome c oxidase subunit 2
VLLGLSTGNAVGLAVVAGIFVAFALASALLIPRRWPDFPGEHLRWFVVGTLVLLVATLAAVEVFAKEPKEEVTAGETTPEPPPATTTQPTQQPPPAASEGDPAAGKEIFAAQGCGSCHVFADAGSTGSVGPDLDEVLQGKDAEIIREAIVDPNKDIAQGYPPNVMPADFGDKLSSEELDDLVAFLAAE